MRYFGSRDAELPKTEVVFFVSTPGVAPVLEWLDQLPAKVQDKCLVRIERLAELGHELRRPEADLLRDGIHELRVRFRTVNYRLLYFFCKGRAVLSHGCTKEKKIPSHEIDTAVANKKLFEGAPGRYTYEE